jgi:hypothetical protein
MEEKKHAKSAPENSVEDPMVTSILGSDEDPCLVEVPQEERVRHETFHEAVKQALAQQKHNEDASRRGKKVEKPDYGNLLSSQELKCLLE